MLSADQLAVADKKYLHNRILLTQVKAFVHCHRNDILIFFSVAGDLLTLSDLLNTADQIAVFHGIFETHFL